MDRTDRDKAQSDWLSLVDTVEQEFIQHLQGSQWGNKAAVSEVRDAILSLRYFGPLFEDANEAFGRLHRLVEDIPVDQRPRLRDLLSQLQSKARRQRAETSAQLAKSPTSCDVLVVAALHQPELSQFVGLLSNPVPKAGTLGLSSERRMWYEGKLADSPTNILSVVALAQDHMGMVDAAALVANAIWTFRPRLVAMTGVCAGREGKVKLGDLIAPTHVVTHDTGKRTAGGLLPEPLVEKISPLVQAALESNGKATLRSVLQSIETTSPVSIAEPTLHTDVMACGSAVIDEPGLLDGLAGHLHRKIVGLEMESYGFLRAVTLTDSRVPALVIKGVMDHGQKKTDDAKRQAAFWAAHFLAKFILGQFHFITSQE